MEQKPLDISEQPLDISEQPLDILEQKIKALLEKFVKLQNEHEQTLNELADAQERIKGLEREKELISHRIQGLLEKFQGL